MAYDTLGRGSGLVLSAATVTTGAAVLPQVGILPKTGGSSVSLIVIAAVLTLSVMIVSRGITSFMRFRLNR